MAYKDEEILKARRAMEQAAKREEEKKHDKEVLDAELEESIFDGMIHIYGEEVPFARRHHEEYGVSMFMPTESFELDELMKKALYPMESRPKYVYGHKSVNITTSLNLTEHKIPTEQIEAFMDYAEKLLRVSGPKVTHLKKRMIKKETYKIGVIEFVSSAIDTKVYNTTFYVVVGENLLIGTIYFPLQYKDRQMKIVKEMVESFEIDKKEKKSE